MEISKEAQEWFDRPLDKSFFSEAGKLTEEQFKQRLEEIPEEYYSLAVIIITTIMRSHLTVPKMTCLQARSLIYNVYMEMKDQNITLPLPYYFFLDGIMIEPEWIVRITNGIIGWSCTKGFDNPEDCGLTNCVFR